MDGAKKLWEISESLTGVTFKFTRQNRQVQQWDFKSDHHIPVYRLAIMQLRT